MKTSTVSQIKKAIYCDSAFGYSISDYFTSRINKYILASVKGEKCLKYVIMGIKEYVKNFKVCKKKCLTKSFKMHVCTEIRKNTCCVYSV